MPTKFKFSADCKVFTSFVYEMSMCGINSTRTFIRGANVICAPVAPGGEGACTLQVQYFKNAETTLTTRAFYVRTPSKGANS